MILFSGLYFFLAYAGFSEQNIPIASYSKVSDVISEKGIGPRYTSKGPPASCYYIKLRATGERWGVYRHGGHYEDLATSFQIGDSIIIYGKRHPGDERINIDLIQAEKPSGEILLDKKEYRKRESSLIYLGLMAGIIQIGLSYWYLKRKILTPRRGH